MELNLFTAILLNVAGIYLLCSGANWLVDGAVSLSIRAGVSTLVAGLTVVSIGTSAPEAASSIVATLQGNGSAALGNVFGSNIANLALIGGICALIRPMKVSRRVVRSELTVMNVVTLMMLVLIWNLKLSRPEGAVLAVVFALLIYILIVSALKGKGLVEPEPVEVKDLSIFAAVGLTVAGLVALTGGAKMAVSGAVFIGKTTGLSDAVIGLTIIAIGTSLPELITCVTASLKGYDDISVGNLIGSNIFNMMFVTGLASLVKPFEFAARLRNFDFAVVIATGLIFHAFATRLIIGKTGGVLLLAIYSVYTAFILFVR
jgi:cation:H+ antiporter